MGPKISNVHGVTHETAALDKNSQKTAFSVCKPKQKTYSLLLLAEKP